MIGLRGISMLAALVIAVHAQSHSQPSEQANRFVSKKYGFSVEIPRGWYAATGGDTPFYFNFPPAKALGQGNLPDGGATLNIVPQDELPGRRHNAPITEWIAEDTRQSNRLSISKIEAPASSEVTEAKLASWNLPTFSPDDEAQHETSIYFNFRERRFAIHLIYLLSDPAGPKYEALLISVFRSIRPEPA